MKMRLAANYWIMIEDGANFQRQFCDLDAVRMLVGDYWESFIMRVAMCYHYANGGKWRQMAFICIGDGRACE